MRTESLQHMVDALRLLGMSYTEIAREVGTHRTSVMRWREGEQRPSGEHLFALIAVAEERIDRVRREVKIIP